MTINIIISLCILDQNNKEDETDFGEPEGKWTQTRPDLRIP